MSTGNRVQGHRNAGYRPMGRRPASSLAAALLAVFMAALMVLSTQTAFARPASFDDGSNSASAGPIPGQGIYTVAFDGTSQAAMKAAQDRVTNIVLANNGRVLCEYPPINAIAICVPDGVAGQLNAVPGVRYVEADVEYHFAMDETAEQVNVTPLWDAIGLPSVPDDRYDGHGVKICVIDSGAATWHPDLKDKIITVLDFIPPNNGQPISGGADTSLSGHGTFVASQIVGSGASSTGPSGGAGIYKGTLPGFSGRIDPASPEYKELRGPFKGLAQGATVIPLRVSVGMGASSYAIKNAIMKAIELDADIISMSMNSGVEDQSMNELVAAAVRPPNNIVFVVSAGNAGDKPGTVQCPGNLPEVITVGAVTRNDEVAEFSSRGPTRTGLMKPDITAVGETVIGASRALYDQQTAGQTPGYDPENNFSRYYQEYSGTSMATPEVSAVAALVIQRYKELYGGNPTPDQVKQILINSARHPYGCPAEGDSNWGHGVLDASAAIKIVENANLIPNPVPTVSTLASFEKPEYTVSEGQGTLAVKVRVADAPADGVMIKVEAFSGSGAIPGLDFAADTKILAFGPGTTTLAFPVTIVDNPAEDGEKAFTIKISPASAQDEVFISKDTCKVTILDDDQATVSFTVDSYTFKAPAGSPGALILPVEVKADWTRNQEAGDISVRFQTFEGSAVPGSDFVPVDRTITIEKMTGETVVVETVDVEIVQGTGPEGLEYFTVKLSDPVNAMLVSPSADTIWVRPSSTDSTPPPAEKLHCDIVQVPPTGGWYTSDVTATITAQDEEGGSGIDYIKYSVNGGPETTVEGGTATATISGNGVNTIDYRATDNCGNARDGVPVTVKIDRAPPVTTCSMESIAGSSNVKVILSAHDGTPGEGTGVKATYYKRTSDSSFDTYTGEFTVQDGLGAIQFYSEDYAGHKEDVKGRPIQVDVTSPVTTCALGGTPIADGWYDEAVTVTLSATDYHTGVQSTEYSLNGGAWILYTGEFAVSAEGKNVLSYRSTDFARNVEVARSVDIKIDRTAPISTCEIDPDTGENGWTNDPPVTVTLKATDRLASGEDACGVQYINYSINNGPWIKLSVSPSRDAGDTWTTYAAEPFTVTAPGITTIKYYAVDYVGNDESAASGNPNQQRVAIDMTPPEITYTLNDQEPTPELLNSVFYGNVKVVFTATDYESGFPDSQSGIVNQVTETVTLTSTENSYTYSVQDRAQNSNSIVVGPLNIHDVPLAIVSFDAPTDPISAPAVVTIMATFEGASSLADNTWTWDDGTGITHGTVEGNVVTATHTYASPGIYTVSLTISDNGATVSHIHNYVVVYDPNSLMSGLGVANSPVGAYLSDPAKGGTDIIATYSRYIHGTMVPWSFCDFNYNSGSYRFDDLLFISTSNDWMVVSGNKAFYQGSGLVMEKRPGQRWQYESGYKFLFAGLDGNKASPKTSDKFRMKIWNAGTGAIKYDNLPDGEIDASPTIPLKCGNILVQG